MKKKETKESNIIEFKLMGIKRIRINGGRIGEKRSEEGVDDKILAGDENI